MGWRRADLLGGVSYPKWLLVPHPLYSGRSHTAQDRRQRTLQ